MTPQLAKWDGCINYCKADACTDCRKLCFFSGFSQKSKEEKRTLNDPVRQQMNDRPELVSTARRIVCSKLQKPLSTKTVIKSTRTPAHAHTCKKKEKKLPLWFLAMHLLGFSSLWAAAWAAQQLQLLQGSLGSSRRVGICSLSSRFCVSH